MLIRMHLNLVNINEYLKLLSSYSYHASRNQRMGTILLMYQVLIKEWKIPPKPNTADEIKCTTPTTKYGYVFTISPPGPTPQPNTLLNVELKYILAHIMVFQECNVKLQIVSLHLPRIP